MNKAKLKEEVKEISEFEENWDGYGAGTFAQKTIDKVYEVIDSLDDKYSDPDVVPSVYGVQLEWENKENGLEIYVEDAGLSHLKVVGKDMKCWTETKMSDMSEINELLEWLYEK